MKMKSPLILIGLFLIITGVFFIILGKYPGLMKLPGNLSIKRGNFIFIFPITLSIILSVILTLMINIFFRK